MVQAVAAARLIVCVPVGTDGVDREHQLLVPCWEMRDSLTNGCPRELVEMIVVEFVSWVHNTWQLSIRVGAEVRYSRSNLTKDDKFEPHGLRGLGSKGHSQRRSVRSQIPSRRVEISPEEERHARWTL